VEAPSTPPPVIIGGPRADRIEVGTLTAVDPSAIGLLDPSNGGLPSSLWVGSDMAQIQALMPYLPVNAASPAMNRLARKLLLSRGPAPNLAPTSPRLSPSLLALKLQRLYGAGELEALAQLAGLISNPASDPDAARILALGFLLQGKWAEASTLADKLVRTSADPLWLQLQAIAQIQAGDNDRADLTLSLLRDMGAPDKVFVSAIDLLRQRPKAKAEKLKQPDPFHLALARLMKWPIPREFLATTEPALIRFFLSAPELDGASRLNLVERLGMMGLGNGQALAELYGGLSLKPEERDRPVDSALKSGGSRARAILYQGGRTAPTTDGQAAALAAGLSLNGDPGLGVFLAEANRGLILTLPQPPILAPYAGALGRIGFLSGDLAAGLRWLDIYRPLAAPGSTSASDLAGLALIAALADPSGRHGVTRTDIDLVIARAATVPVEQRAARLAIMNACLNGLGLVPTSGATPMPVLKAQADQATQAAMMAAAEGGKIGETAILALALIGTQGPQSTDPHALEAALSALSRVGLNLDARRIAVEAALSYGL
jgi:hypothetical protein